MDAAPHPGAGRPPEPSRVEFSPPFHHPWFGRCRVRATVVEQPAADEARTQHTVTLMAAYVREDSRAPSVRQAAYDAISGLERRDPRAEAVAVWDWVRRRVRFLEDRKLASSLAGVDADEAEVLVRPVDLLAMPQPAGDCDDFSMLVASMLRALGIPASFRAVAADPAQPETYSHVYVVAELPDGELALDASHGPRAGWEAPPAGKTRTWRIDEMPSTLGGIEIDWGQLIEAGSQTGFDILKARYGQPPAGTYIQRTPQGEIFYRQPRNAPPYTFPGGGFGLTPSNTTTLLLIVGAVVVLVLIMRRGGDK